jgi:hypothetical protein
LYGGATIAEHLGLPFISLANVLLLNREEVIPPPVMLWLSIHRYPGLPKSLMVRHRRGCWRHLTLSILHPSITLQN